MFGRGLVKGLVVTMRHFIESYTYDRKPWQWLSRSRYNEEWLDRHQAIDGKGIFTIQYPEEKRVTAERFRFYPVLIYEQTPDHLRCTACGICARVCPPQCIWIERGTDEKGRPTADPNGFWIDGTICMQCGYCAEYCPFDAIKMDHHYELGHTDRFLGLLKTRRDLLKSAEYHESIRPTEARQVREALAAAAAEKRRKQQPRPSQNDTP